MTRHFCFLIISLWGVLIQAQTRPFEGNVFKNSVIVAGQLNNDKIIVQSSYNGCLRFKLSFRPIDTLFYFSANNPLVIHSDSLANFFYPDSLEQDSIFKKGFIVESNMPISLVKEYSLEASDRHVRFTLLEQSISLEKQILLHGRYNSQFYWGGSILNLFSIESSQFTIKPIHPISYKYNGIPVIASANSAANISLAEHNTAILYCTTLFDQLYGFNSTVLESDSSISAIIIDAGNMDCPEEGKFTCSSPTNLTASSFPTYQNKPLQMAGTYYPFTPVNKQGKDYVHLLATQPNTNLFYNGQFIKTLDSLELWDTCFYDAGIISANKPLMFGQFVQRNAVSVQNFEILSIGVQTSDTAEYIHKTIFDATPNVNIDSTVFPMNITAYTADTALLLHNGLPLHKPGWQTFSGNPNLCWCTYLVQPGVHVLESSGKFAALYYPHSFDNPPNYLYREVSSYMLPGVTPTKEAADSIQFYYQTTTGQKEPWANGTVTACSGVALTLYPNIARHTTWQWAFGDGSTQTQRVGNQRAQPISHTWQTPGQYWVTVSDSAGCSNGDSLLVIVDNGPLAAFSYTTNTGCSGTFVQLQNESMGATNYQWQWPGGSSTQPNPGFVYAGQDSTLSVTLIATDGTCSDTATQTLNLKPSTFNPRSVPNVITPNQDGVNDAFCIPNTGGYQDCYKLEIFSRWGNLVYTSQNPQDCWQPATIAPGVYFYVLTLGTKLYSGEVTVF